MENKYLKLKNLNNAYVITKKHNGNTFFVRIGFITCRKNYPHEDCIYYDEASAIAEVTRLNSLRKKCKYSYENASKYFVNNWFSSNWNGANILNKPLSIKKVNANTKISTPDEVRKSLMLNIEKSIYNKSESIKRIQKELPEKIKSITEQHDNYIQEYNNERSGLETQLAELSSLDLDSLLAGYETQGDKMVKVLYGSNK